MSAEGALSTIGANRLNIPAICRIPGCGTAFLVAPGLLLTSKKVVTSKAHAAKLQAVFFESGKRSPVTVNLNPGHVYFSATYPDHLDYCLVACETAHIYGVKPVKLPMSHIEWSDVHDKDVVLVVQHDIYDPKGQEQKRFEVVQQVQNDMITFAVTDSEVRVAGCPVFNDQGQLVALFHQCETMPSDEEGAKPSVTATAVHISSIVKHMFALMQLSRIENGYPFDEIWHTWGGADIARVIRIIQNFPDLSTASPTLMKLCEQCTTSSSPASTAADVVSNGGVPVMISYLGKSALDARCATCILQALWNISVSSASPESLFTLENIRCIVAVITRLVEQAEVVQYGTVLLFNVVKLVVRQDGNSAEAVEKVFSTIVDIIVKCMERYDTTEVVLKFGIGCLNEISRVGIPKHIQQIVDTGAIQIASRALCSYPKNEYLNEYTVGLLALVAQQHNLIAHSSVRTCVVPLLEAVQRFPANKVIQSRGNDAIWHLGVDVENRVKIVSSGGLQVVQSSVKHLLE